MSGAATLIFFLRTPSGSVSQGDMEGRRDGVREKGRETEGGLSRKDRAGEERTEEG